MSKNYSLKNFGVYIWTSNQLMHCVPAWAYLFNKFWPYEQNVVVLGYDQPNFDMPDNFEYISLGHQRGPKYWSDDMMDYFKGCAHESFYLTTEDGFIVEPVNKDILSMAIKTSFINPNNKFLRFNLTCDVQSRSHEVLKDYETHQLVRATQNTMYRQSLNHSIWRKDSLLDKLIPNQSPWDFELDNKRAKFDQLDVYGTRGQYAISCGHGYKKGKKIPDWYKCTHPHITGKQGLTEEDVKYIEDKGWMPEI